MDRPRLDDGKYPPPANRPLLALLVCLLSLSLIGPAVEADHLPGHVASTFVIAGANAYIDGVCERSAAGLLSAAKYYNMTMAANDDNVSYGGSVILANDATSSGSENVTFGMRNPFIGLRLNINTAGTEGSVRWKYWDGDEWKSLPLLSNPTDHFRVQGTHTILWDAPADWQPRRWAGFGGIDRCKDQRPLYWVMVETEALYQVQPLANHMGTIVPNLRIQAVTELGELISGLQASDFLVADGSDTTIYGLTEPEFGEYELALDTHKLDRDFSLSVQPIGFSRSSSIATGVLSTTLLDRTATPLVVPYPIRVTVRSDENQPIEGATVTFRDQEADSFSTEGRVHYFRATQPGELAVSAAGYESFSTAVDTAARNVYPGSIAPTQVLLTGTAPCDATTETAAGESVTCRGLRRTGTQSSASNPTTAQRPVSFSFPISRGISASQSNNESKTTAPAPPCDPRAPPPDGTYTKTVDQLKSDELVRLCVDQASAAGVERVDVALGLEAEEVQVVVQAAPEFRTQWAIDGIELPPGDHHFGFLTVGVTVEGAKWEGPIEATTVRFHVSHAQLAEAGLDAENVQVYRWDGEAWESVPTSIESETESDYAFSASAPGQGLFAVSGVSAAEVPGMPVWPWVVGGLVATGLIGLGIATTIRRRHHHHHEEAMDAVPKPPVKPAHEAKPEKPAKIPYIR